MRPLDPRLLRHARSTRPFLAVLVGAGAITAGLVIVQAGVLADAITAVFLGGAGTAAIGGSVIVLAAVLAGRAALAWVVEVATHRAAATARGELRSALLAHAVRLGPRELAGRHDGELATLATRGLDALDPYFARYLPQLVLAAIVPATVGAAVLWHDWPSAVVVALTVPLIPVFMALVGLHTRDRARRQWRGLARLAHHFLDVVQGLPTLRAYGRSAAQREVLAAVGDAHRRATMRALRTAFLSSLVLELLATLSVALVAVGIGLRLAGGSLDLRTALLVLIVVPEVYLPLRAVGTQFHAAAEGVSAAEQAFAVLETPLPVAGGVLEPPAAPVVRLRGAGVDGRGGEPVLDGLDLDLAPGRVVGLAGPSGSGKSTTIAVLLGFCALDRGAVRVGSAVPATPAAALAGPDGDAGTDLADLDLGAWRSRIAWVPQRSRVFGATVADAIRLGYPAAADGDVARAARAAGLDVPLDAPIGDGGAGLSTGQQRRVAVARALVAGRPVLLLDEPTVGVDAATELAIVASVRAAAAHAAVLVVSHRQAVLDACDTVVRLAPMRDPSAVAARPAHAAADGAGSP